ncbi:vomeronasal type-1 receptor 2-like [Echinops telfairi]|uniref:Vomeronasal type-1 receptor n=1 Tax=Echinops telfairi TaxID=9371 RepID=A0ABM1VKL2_ECHTE|nr:vomeronasal type-1 receptor 2-like [Echinops telfairi]
MASINLQIAVVLLFQVALGTLGNVSLLILRVFFRFHGGRSRSTNLILRTLAAANLLVIFSKGVPQTMLAFGVDHFLSDAGCKLVFYLERVASSVSTFTTCFLSVFQTITISPTNSMWATFKVKAVKYISPTNTLCWILPMLVNAIFPIYGSGTWSNKTMTKKTVWQYCASHHDNVTFSLYVALISSHDVLCVGFMTWASGSMICILYRHNYLIDLQFFGLDPMACRIPCQTYPSQQ